MWELLTAELVHSLGDYLRSRVSETRRRRGEARRGEGGHARRLTSGIGSGSGAGRCTFRQDGWGRAGFRESRAGAAG